MKKRFSVLLLLVLVLALGLAACGDEPAVKVVSTTAASTTAAKTTAAATIAPTTVATTAAATTAVATTSATTTAAATTAAPTTAATTTTKPATTTAAATTTKPAGEVKRVEGAGKELIGDAGAVEDFDVMVIDVARLESVTDTITNKPITPKTGVFLAVVYKVANLGKTGNFLSGLKLTDGNKTEYKETDDISASVGVVKALGYKNNFVIQPGFVATTVEVYDVPKDAQDFKIYISDLYTPDPAREVSEDSFKTSGGKGPDSGAGQELVGKSANVKVDYSGDDYSVKVTKVERVGEIKGRTSTIKTDGVFLIVQYDIQNNGKKDLTFASFMIKDQDERQFSSESDFDIFFALNDKYKPSDKVAPGASGKGYAVFQVTKDAANLDLTTIK